MSAYVPNETLRTCLFLSFRRLALAERLDEHPTNRRPSFAVGEWFGIKAADVYDEPNHQNAVDLAADEDVIKR